MGNNNLQFKISKKFDAPRHKVWQAWTDPKLVKQWFGPKGCTIPKCEIDLRVGGGSRYSMDFNGMTMSGRWLYKELDAPKKLVAIVSFTDASGENIIAHPMSPDWPLEILSDVTFEENNGQTEIKVIWSPYNSSERELRTFAEGVDGMKQGWGGTFEQLEDFLKKSNNK